MSQSCTLSGTVTNRVRQQQFDGLKLHPVEDDDEQSETKPKLSNTHRMISGHSSSGTTHEYLLNTGSLSVMTPWDRSSAWTVQLAPENTTSAPLVLRTIFSIKKHERAAVASTPTWGGGGGGCKRKGSGKREAARLSRQPRLKGDAARVS